MLRHMHMSKHQGDELQNASLSCWDTSVGKGLPTTGNGDRQ